MKKVIRYECEFCKKLFKINRHFCFKDPANRACASCRYYLGREDNMANYGYKYRSYVCGYDSGCYSIYQDPPFWFSGVNTEEVPFQSHHGSRGYNCDWWELREKEN